MSEIFELFQPGARYLEEERERKRSEIVYAPSSAPGRGEIDLDSGVVVITRHDGAPPADDASD